MELLNGKNTYEQMSLLTKNKNNSYKKKVSKDKILVFINYYPKIPQNFSLPKVHGPGIPRRPVISEIVTSENLQLKFCPFF